METFLANLAGKTRRASLNGREYIVAPMSLIVPGVLNGSKGSLYYPPDEVSRDPSSWNGIPITLGHPTHNGNHVSARSPGVLDEYGLGTVFESVYNGKHIAEGWFDIELTKNRDKRLAKEGKPTILNRLEAGEPIEISTGLFTDNEAAPKGSHYNGKPYDYIARNYRPDHLAVLPDQKGACSVADGCGLNVNGDAKPDEEFTRNVWYTMQQFWRWVNGRREPVIVPEQFAATGGGELYATGSRAVGNDDPTVNAWTDAARAASIAARKANAASKHKAATEATEIAHISSEKAKIAGYAGHHSDAAIAHATAAAAHMYANDALRPSNPEQANLHLKAYAAHSKASNAHDKETIRKLNGNAQALTNNPASWVADEGTWEKAKAEANKGNYEKDSDQYWAVAATIYKNMGGKRKDTTDNSFDPNQPRDADGKWAGGGKEEFKSSTVVTGGKTFSKEESIPSGPPLKVGSKVTIDYLGKGAVHGEIVKVEGDVATVRQEGGTDTRQFRLGELHPTRGWSEIDLELELNFDTSQPRADDGKWTSGGGGQKEFHGGGMSMIPVTEKAARVLARATAVKLKAGEGGWTNIVGEPLTKKLMRGVHENQEDIPRILDGIFSRMTLGTGPIAVSAIKLGVKHAPKAFNLLFKAAKALGRGMGHLVGGSSEYMDEAGGMVDTALAGNAEPKGEVDEDALAEGYLNLGELATLLEDPKEAEAFLAGLKAIQSASGDNTTQNQGDTNMDRTQTINWLTVNCECWKGDEKTLNSLPDAKLTLLKTSAEKSKVLEVSANALLDIAKKSGAPPEITVNAMPAFIAEKMEEKKSATKKEGCEEEKLTGNKAPTLKEWEDSMPLEARAVWNSAKEIEKRERTAIVNRLTANVQGDDRKNLSAMLMTKPLDELRGLLRLIPATNDFNQAPAPVDPVINYLGAAGGFTGNAGGDIDGEDILRLPTMNDYCPADDKEAV